MPHTQAPAGRTITAEAGEDRQGRPCLKVALSGRVAAGRVALLDAAGLAALQKAGARSLYVVPDAGGREYVCYVPRNGGPTTAARTVAGDPEGKRIEFISGDRLDLRSRNLHARSYAKVGACRSAKVAA